MSKKKLSNKFRNQRSVAGTLWLLKLGWFCNHFLMIAPVIVLAYTQKGITIGDFFLIQGLFRIAAFLFEIPSGYLSDRFSRRRILILGTIIHMFGYATLAMAYGFWQIVLGESLLGISIALFSGTLEAYTYDLLKRNHTQKYFLKEFGSIKTYGQTASFIAAILAGFTFNRIGGTGIFWIEALLCLVALLFVYFIPELTEIHRKKAKNKTALADAVGICYRTLKNSKLRNLIFFPSLFSAFTIVLLWIIQPVMETTHVPTALFGIYFGIYSFSTILFAKYAHKICAKLGEIAVSRITIFAVILGIILTFMTIHTSNMIFICLACGIMEIIPAIRVLSDLQYNTLIHNDIESQERGTVLSTRMMVSSATGAAMLAMAKFMLDNYGISITMLFMLAMTIFLFMSLKHIRKYIKK